MFYYKVIHKYKLIDHYERKNIGFYSSYSNAKLAIDKTIMKILGAIVFGLVTWAILDAIFNVLYTTIDNAILSSGESVSWLLKAMKVVVGFLAMMGFHLHVVF